MTIGHGSRPEKLKRRLVSIPALFVTCFAVTVLVPVWLPVAVIVAQSRFVVGYELSDQQTRVKEAAHLKLLAGKSSASAPSWPT